MKNFPAKSLDNSGLLWEVIPARSCSSDWLASEANPEFSIVNLLGLKLS